MKAIYQLLTIGLVLTAGCSNENQPELNDGTTTEIKYSGERVGGGKDNKETIIIRPNVVNSSGEQSPNTEVHVSNSQYYTWGTIGELDTLMLDVPEFGPYEYTIYQDNSVVLQETFEIYDSLVHRVDTL